MSNNLKNEIITTFKLNGLTVRSEATKYCLELLNPLEDSERSSWLEKLVETVQKQGLDSTTIDKSHLEKAAKECCQNECDDEDTADFINVISAFEFPKFVYHIERKKYLLSENLSLNLFGESKDKAEMFRHRYALLHQRTSRHNLFTPSILGTASSASQGKYQLQPIEYLLGISTKLSNIVVLGMLVYLSEGKLYLEDPTGCVPVSLKDANFHGGLFTENSFVLGQGNYSDGIFHIEHLGLPPAEPANVTRTYFGNSNFFGGPSASCLKTSVKLKFKEDQNPDAMVVFLSDVWLDQIQVLEKLRILFSGYCEVPPVAFVLMGNFLSGSQGNSSPRELRKLFKTLADLIKEFQNLVENSRFIIVPGPSDLGFSNIIPRPQLPECIRIDFEQRIPNCIFTTNPCRINCGTKEIVVLREDVLSKMCRNALYFPESDDIPQQFAKTIASQGHLCPLPGEMCPIYWPYDYTLSLYPLPDLVCIGDRFGAFTAQHMDCIVMNPGPFSRNNFNFKVFFPATNTVEDSEIGD